MIAKEGRPGGGMNEQQVQAWRLMSALVMLRTQREGIASLREVALEHHDRVARLDEVLADIDRLIVETEAELATIPPAERGLQ
jgi:hypothetical protein